MVMVLIVIMVAAPRPRWAGVIVAMFRHRDSQRRPSARCEADGGTPDLARSALPQRGPRQRAVRPSVAGAVAVIGPGAVGAALGVSLALFLDLVGRAPEARQLTQTLYSWLAAGDFQANIGFLVDPLSATLMLVVTGVGFLIHVYSVGYMHEEDRGGFARYFTYLNLFTFAMLLLVMADNFLLLFVGWEGVGLCSYLLIGFWFKDSDNATAGKKAFIVNRIGDFGFLLGIFLIFGSFGSVAFADVFPNAASVLAPGGDLAFWICLFLFVGAVGKSAQIPLYVWLPDAMAGPTPVSALIHAATMVTAGVYMVARSHALYDLAPDVLAIVAGIGAATALYAATIGLVQTDIKKVLAYSTISQLGYMFPESGWRPTRPGSSTGDPRVLQGTSVPGRR
jgi:NADH-quinone oxidoreductase subunit L